jgi:hypothetical protein
MQNKVNQNKEFKHALRLQTPVCDRFVTFKTMQKPRSINELLQAGSKRLADLQSTSEGRTLALKHVCAALPPKLAEAVVSAGIEQGRLTIGVAGAPWAARLRYLTDPLRLRVAASLGVDIPTIRIKVVPPRA